MHHALGVFRVQILDVLLVILMGAVQIEAAAEGLLIAESRQMVEGDQAVTFAAKWRVKDTRYGLELARKLGQETPLGQAAFEAFQRLIDQGLGEENESRVIDVLRS